MIKVERKPKPARFDAETKRPGLAWLRQRRGARHDLKAALPSRGAVGFIEDFWSGGEKLWRAAIPHLERDYDEICAYSALRLAPATATSTVDHFVPKSQRPDLAFEWNNFRLASLRVNGKRGTKPVIDPFKVGPDWFFLEFAELSIYANPSLKPTLRGRVDATIDDLGLDGPRYRRERADKWRHYLTNHDGPYLRREAPHVYAEAERQGLLA